VYCVRRGGDRLARRQQNKRCIGGSLDPNLEKPIGTGKRGSAEDVYRNGEDATSDRDIVVFHGRSDLVTAGGGIE
jgi:hypothetical protein